MTTEDILKKQQAVKDAWAALPHRENFSTWVFNEELCQYDPPIPRPENAENYIWQGTTQSWVPRPEYPNDGKWYDIDYSSASWVEVEPKL